MKHSLVVAHLFHRPGRTLATVIGLAVAVCLVVLMVGLAHGQISSRGKREAAVGAEIMAGPRGYFRLGPTTAPLMMSIETGKQLLEVDGVQAVAPLGQFVESGAGGIGFQMIDGIDLESYRRITPLEFMAGGPMTGPEEAIVDPVVARSRAWRVGQMIDALGHRFRIAGIYRSETGARIKISLGRMQELAGEAGRCSAFLIKCHDTSQQEATALRLQTTFPEYQFILTRDIPSFYVQHAPAALNTFLNVVILLAIIISVLVVLLTMYTAVHERTREIGILKSLGASRRYIVQIFEKEAVGMSVLGVMLGSLASWAAAGIMRATTELTILLEIRWILIVAGITILSSAAGGLYPGMRAASQDPVEALSYE